MSDSKILSITVADAAVVNGDLQIGGSFANDTITVNPSKDKSQLVVKLGRSMLGSFPLASVTGRIVVHALGGNDKVTISSKVTKPADLFGGSSNDILTGGAGDDRLFGEAGEDSLIGGKGNNLLVGGVGNDRLTGGTSRDVLIGGAGSDKVSGAAGDDLLIGGPTDFDTDLASLANIVAEWKSDSTYADRILHLKGTTGGANLSTFLSATTVHDDGVKDVLTGAAGTDWFVIGALDLTLGALKTETKTTF
jgi:Ca2+-binding RTX toxin-like protein